MARVTQGCFSLLPDLTDTQIEAQIKYCISNGFAISIESKILELLSSNNTNFLELGMSIGKENKDYYLKSKKSTNQSWDLLDKEAKDSIAEQEALEKNDSLSFEAYVEN